MKEKMNNITELVFILDCSGSIAGLEADTIGGFNSMIEKQRKEDGDNEYGYYICRHCRHKNEIIEDDDD